MQVNNKNDMDCHATENPIQRTPCSHLARVTAETVAFGDFASLVVVAVAVGLVSKVRSVVGPPAASIECQRCRVSFCHCSIANSAVTTRLVAVRAVFNIREGSTGKIQIQVGFITERGGRGGTGPRGMVNLCTTHIVMPS